MAERDNEQFLATMRKQFEQDCTDEAPLRKDFDENLGYVVGEGQWDEAVKNDRVKNQRPCLTFNRMPVFVQQVANEARQNKSEIRFAPAEDGDVETAKIYEGLARYIQNNSEAKIAFETAVEYAAGGNFGYYRMLPDYASDEGFEQEVKFMPVMDPMSVYGVLLPYCFRLKPDHAFVIEEIPAEQYKRQYPKHDATKSWDLSVQNSEGWVSKDTVRIAEYWYIDSEDVEIKSEDGKRTRTVQKNKVKFCKTNGVEVWDETEWLGQRIPIFPVIGGLKIYKGKPKLSCVVTNQKDAQRLINFYKTRIAETLGTAPLTPFIAAEGQLEGHEQEWANINTKMQAVVQYKPMTVDGQPAPPPQRQVYEPPIMALSNAAAQEIDDMKATAGIFDASLGAKSNETAGIAIARRQQQSDMVNMHFLDNLARTQDESGRELAYVMPLYYDTPRIVRILGEDEQPQQVRINQEYVDPKTQKPVTYKIGGDGVAKYDIIVTQGKTYSSKRMESFDMMGQVVQANPNILPMIGDVLFKNSDVAGADQLAERFKKMLPPNLQEQPEGQPEIPPEAQQAITQLQQQNQQLNAYAQQVEQKLKESDNSAVESKERIEMAKMQLEQAKLGLEQQRLQLDAAKAHAEMDSKEAIVAFQAEIELLKTNLNNLMAAHQASQQAAQDAVEVSQTL